MAKSCEEPWSPTSWRYTAYKIRRFWIRGDLLILILFLLCVWYLLLSIYLKTNENIESMKVKITLILFIFFCFAYFMTYRLLMGHLMTIFNFLRALVSFFYIYALLVILFLNCWQCFIYRLVLLAISILLIKTMLLVRFSIWKCITGIFIKIYVYTFIVFSPLFRG